jgi:hypothetical protein
LPADPKTQIGFVSRLDLTGLRQSLTDIDGFDRNRPDRPDCRRRRGRLVASESSATASVAAMTIGISKREGALKRV